LIAEIVAWPRERLEQVSTRIAFFIAGFVMAAWAPLVPFAKARAAIDDGVLGLILLSLGVGSIVTMPLAGALAARFGCRLVIAVSTVLLCLTLPMLATVVGLPLLIGAVLVFGAGVGALDVAINIQAIIVERASGRSMMSGFHGQFSLGGMAGAAGVTALLGAGSSPFAATLCVSAAILVMLALAAPHLLPYGARREGPVFAFPHGVVLFIGVLCFIVFLTEGAVLDWSAVFLTSARGMEASYAGLGYAAFALTMTVGRIGAGSVLASFTARLRHGRRRLLQRRACPVHQCRPTDRHARTCRGSSDHDARICRHPRRSRSDRPHGARGQPFGRIPDAGDHAVRRRGGRPPTDHLTATCGWHLGAVHAHFACVIHEEPSHGLPHFRPACRTVHPVLRDER
jgi:hypothetical protein